MYGRAIGGVSGSGRVESESKKLLGRMEQESRTGRGKRSVNFGRWATGRGTGTGEWERGKAMDEWELEGERPEAGRALRLDRGKAAGQGEAIDYSEAEGMLARQARECGCDFSFQQRVQSVETPRVNAGMSGEHDAGIGTGREDVSWTENQLGSDRERTMRRQGVGGSEGCGRSTRARRA